MFNLLQVKSPVFDGESINSKESSINVIGINNCSTIETYKYVTYGQNTDSEQSYVY